MPLSSVAAQYVKAIVAFVVPGVVALVAAVVDGSPGGSSITAQEWVGILAACVLTAGSVAASPRNRAPGPDLDNPRAH